MLEIKCPLCFNVAQIPESAASKSVRCESCGKIFKIVSNIIEPTDAPPEFEFAFTEPSVGEAQEQKPIPAHGKTSLVANFLADPETRGVVLFSIACVSLLILGILWFNYGVLAPLATIGFVGVSFGTWFWIRREARKGNTTLSCGIGDFQSPAFGAKAAGQKESASTLGLCPNCGQPIRNIGKFCGSCGHGLGRTASQLSNGCQGMRAMQISPSTALKLFGGLVALVVLVYVGVNVRNLIVSTLDSYRKEQGEQIRIQAEREARKKAEDEAAAAKWIAEAPKRIADAEEAEAARILERSRIREEREKAWQEMLAQKRKQAVDEGKARREMLAQAQKRAEDEEKARQEKAEDVNKTRHEALAEIEKMIEKVEKADQEKLAQVCVKCNGTGLIDTYKVYGTYNQNAQFPYGREMVNGTYMAYLIKKSLNAKEGKPNWETHVRSDGLVEVRRTTPTTSYCNCQAGKLALQNRMKDR